MKKYIILISCFGFFTLFTSSCEKYLDKAPLSTFTEDEVFSNIDNFKQFFDAVYFGMQTKPGDTNEDYYHCEDIHVGFNLYFAGQPDKYSFDQLTELSDGGRIRNGHNIKGGIMLTRINNLYDSKSNRPMLTTYFNLIRICNIALKKIHLLKDVKQTDIDDIIGQAHLVRAFSHYALFRFWGPMPYITKEIGPYDSWDLPRLSKHATCLAIAADCDTAATFFEKANAMRRDDPAVGGAGHLNNPEQWRPTGTCAVALKGRILLYAASPLNNELGKADWEEAAKANWEAIQVAEHYGYFMLDAANYKQNYIGVNYSDEQIWGYTTGLNAVDSDLTMFLQNGIFANSSGTESGCSPTQNCVDKFETKWGDPLNTQADRDAATTLGHYNEQDPYANRDPRFYIDIIYNQAPIPGYITAQMWFQNVAGKVTYSELLNQSFSGVSHTGYYDRKIWGEHSVKNNIKVIMTDPVIRLKELYLNYAEAANEAYGPNTPAPGATLSAVQAINLVRSKIGQVDVQPQFTVNTDAFRPRIKNERTVELVFEGHYYFDSRRWMDAPAAMSAGEVGMSIEKVPVSPTYPIGFKHTRVPLEVARQTVWKDEMYYFPFKDADYYKMKNFDMSLNPRW
jgi:starch-binding outer membrane protein, SusD/RagB family